MWANVMKVLSVQAELAIAGVGADGAQGLQATAGTVAAAFALVFVAEWGDKSFFSTIGMWALCLYYFAHQGHEGGFCHFVSIPQVPVL
jgi:putative Ca2+/H+ antiporter (TMEM165/GDT1 family)